MLDLADMGFTVGTVPRVDRSEIERSFPELSDRFENILCEPFALLVNRVERSVGFGPIAEATKLPDDALGRKVVEDWKRRAGDIRFGGAPSKEIVEHIAMLALCHDAIVGSGSVSPDVGPMRTVRAFLDAPADARARRTNIDLIAAGDLVDLCASLDRTFPS